MRISNQRALEILTDVPEPPKVHQITHDKPRSWMPLATFCGMSIGSSILFIAINVIFLKIEEWVFHLSSDGFVRLLQMMMLVMMAMVLVLLGLTLMYYHKYQLKWIELPLLFTGVGLIASIVPVVGILGSLLMFTGGIWTTVRIAHMPWTI